MAVKRFQAVVAVVLLSASVGSIVALAASGGGKPDDPPAKPATAPSPALATKPAARPIRDVLRDAARAAAPEGATKDNARVQLQIARAQARAGDRDGALATARRVSEIAEDLTPRAAASTLFDLAYIRDAAGDREGALKELARADRFPDDKSGGVQTPLGTNRYDWFPARLLIADALYDLGQVEAARATSQVMAAGVASFPKNSDRLGPAGELVKLQIKIGDVDGAFRTSDQADQAVPHNKGHVLRDIAQAATSGSHGFLLHRKELPPEERAARLPILKRVEETAEGYEFEEQKPYVDLAIAWATLGDFDSALRIAHRIGKGPIRFANAIDPAGIVYVLSAIANMQARAGCKAEAAATIREVLDLLERRPGLGQGHFEQVAGAQLAAGAAVGAAKTMELAGPEGQVRWLSGIAQEQAKAGDRDAARATLRRALDEAERLLDTHAPPPTPFEEEQRRLFPANFSADRGLARKDSIRGQIAEIHARLGHPDAATTFLRKITPGTWPSRFSAQSIARARAEEGDLEGALNWAMTLEPPLRVEALRGLAEGVADR
jgi:tetratricopeptide (TPR) repeat protein